MAPEGGQNSKTRHYGDSDFVVVANRLPVDLERLPDGTTSWKRSPGGLVTALEPLLRRRRGAWVGWPGVVDDVVDVVDEPVAQDELQLHPVRLSADDVAQYYEGFSNATLWPLYHDVIVKPLYHREWWERYVEVNKGLCEQVVRRRLAAIPDGVYEAFDWAEYDGHGTDSIYRIGCRVIIREFSARN